MATQSLEDIIRDLAKRGEISHISLVPSQGGKTWRASFAMCSKFGLSFSEDPDPVKALVLALTTAKMKPRRGIVINHEDPVDAVGPGLIPEPDATGVALENDPYADIM